MTICSKCEKSDPQVNFTRNQLRKKNPKCKFCIGDSDTVEVKSVSKFTKKNLWKPASQLPVSVGNSQPGKNAWDSTPKLKCDPTETLPQKSSGKKEVRPEGFEIDEFLLGLTIEDYVFNTGKIGNIPLLMNNLTCRYALAKTGQAPPVLTNKQWMVFLTSPKLEEQPLFQVNPERFLRARDEFVIIY